MLNVFVVDDQISVRIGFRNLDWAQYGCALVGDAGNGIEALDRIAVLKPDVVISDIRMPQMDGLELSRLIKRMYPECAIVLLTGYDEFSYAQQALNIGVDHLLLKPTNFDELARTLALLAEKQARNRDVSLPSKLHVSNLMQENLLRDMIYGKTVHQEILKMMRLEACLASRYALMAIVPEIPSAELFTARCERIRNICQDVAQESDIEILSTLTDEACVCMLMRDQGFREEQLLAAGQDIFSRLVKYHACPTIIGIYSSGDDDVTNAYRHAIQALNDAFCTRNDISIYHNQTGTKSDISHINAGQEQLISLMYAGNVQGIQAWFGSMRDTLQQMSIIQNEETYRAIGTGLFSLILDIYQTLKSTSLVTDESCLQKLQAFVQAKIPETLPRIFLEVCSLTSEIAELIANASRVRIVTEMLTFIKARYECPDLSLDVLSEVFHLSPSHVSRLIKRETGKSFVNHLAGYRIKKAKQLLADQDQRIPDIVQAVGFRDPSYFIRVFKKHVGITPMRYRQMHRRP
jgi:two-component system response regulator YesN